METNLMLYLGAMTLGALHAFEPGHGKTLIAAYMIGTKGRAVDGMILGLIVTFTHTFSVIILGIIAKVLAKSYSEEQLHGWLGLFSAALILGVGIWMLRQRLKHSGGHVHLHLFGKAHSHGPHDHIHHDHDHAHHDHDHNHHHHDGHDHHDHDHDHHHHDSHTHHDHGHDHGHSHNEAHSHGHEAVAQKGQPQHRPGKLDLLVLGISGGLVPCPAAIATLLAAIAAGRTAQGLTLAIFFSLGLGLVMMVIGVVLSHASKLTDRLDSSPEFSRKMGILSALVITVLGAVTLFHSVKSLWFSGTV